MRTKGYFRALLIAFFASFAAPLTLSIAVGINNVLTYGQLNIAVLFAYGFAVLAFSAAITCAFVAVVVFMLRLTNVSVSDGFAAIVAAVVIIVLDALFMGVNHAIPWIALPVGANALVFFILDKVIKINGVSYDNN